MTARVTRRRRPSIVEVEATEEAERPTGDFADLFFAHERRLCRKWFHYFEAYDTEFGRFRGH